MCLYPIKAVSYEFLLNGKKETRIKITKDQELFINKNKNVYFNMRSIDLKCSKCFECCLDYSNEWAYRVYCESLCHDENCFITLTYENDNAELSKRDLQLFLKRLRKKIYPLKIRFFACGEYGSKRLRPHYHLILFGYVPKDLQYFYTTKKSEEIYKSEEISKLWNNGFISVGFVSIDSAKYCAKYMQKLALKDKRLKVLIEFFGAEKPFTLMSTKPGIGLNYFKNNLDLLNTDKIYSNKGFRKIPRYFLDYAENVLGLCIDNLKEKRKLKADLLRLTNEELEKKRKLLFNRLYNK